MNKKARKMRSLVKESTLYAHRESRVGPRYNATIRDLDSFNEEKIKKYRYQRDYRRTYNPYILQDRIVEEFLEKCKRVSDFNDDYFFSVLHHSKYNIKKAIKHVKKYCARNIKTDNKCGCFCHIYSDYDEKKSTKNIPKFTSEWGTQLLLSFGYSSSEINTLLLTDAIDISGDLCWKCKKTGNLLICDGTCGHAFHLTCVGLHDIPLSERWYCEQCFDKMESLKLIPCEIITNSHIQHTLTENGNKILTRIIDIERSLSDHLFAIDNSIRKSIRDLQEIQRLQQMRNKRKNVVKQRGEKNKSQSQEIVASPHISVLSVPIQIAQSVILQQDEANGTSQSSQGIPSDGDLFDVSKNDINIITTDVVHVECQTRSKRTRKVLTTRKEQESNFYINSRTGNKVINKLRKELFKCPLGCSNTYSYKYSLSKHLLKHHNGRKVSEFAESQISINTL